jgi:hypothetical protein
MVFNECWAKIPDTRVKALKRADMMLDWESGALFTAIVQLYPCGGGPAVVTATCDNVRYKQYSLRLASKRGLGWYVAMSRNIALRSRSCSGEVKIPVGEVEGHGWRL